MRQRLIAALAAVAIGIVGAVVFASPSNASTTVPCNFPDAPEITSVTKGVAQEAVTDNISRFAKCLEIVWTDQCDQMTFVQMTNWVKNDNDWTVVTVKLLDKEYVLEGGSSPNTEEALIGPKATDVQAYLIFRGEKDGTKWEFQVPFEEPHTWKDPGAVCPSPSATPSPSAVPTSAAPATSDTTSPAAPVTSGNDLPVTGISATWMAVGVVLLLLVAGGAEFLRRRRNREPVA